jgi:protein-S-isoprenylcysteine O-methyltransferase Ste14
LYRKKKDHSDNDLVGKMKETLRYLSSLIAPFFMCLVLPYFIVRFEHQSPSVWSMMTTSTSLFIIGFAITVGGLVIFIATIIMFIQIGNGTIMPWDPTTKLIVTSMYSHVRNPMILSLIVLQIGEAVLFTSYGIAALAIVNFTINTVYFIYSEEPGLEKRFGDAYVEYMKHVPRWIPRLKPWRPN